MNIDLILLRYILSGLGSLRSLGDVGNIVFAPQIAQQKARAKVIEAQGEKEAKVIEAEGEREAKVIEAEGEREARVIKAQGEREARVIEAEGEREAKVIKAQGEKEARIIEEEGEKEARIIEEEGEKEARVIEAEGEKKVIEITDQAVVDAINTFLSQLRSQITERESILDDETIEQRISYQAEKKQRNIVSVIQEASQQLEDKEVPDQEPDHDWTSRFFNHIQDVSDEEIQILWAKILAGEVESKGVPPYGH